MGTSCAPSESTCALQSSLVHSRSEGVTDDSDVSPSAARLALARASSSSVGIRQSMRQPRYRGSGASFPQDRRRQN